MRLRFIRIILQTILIVFIVSLFLFSWRVPALLREASFFQFMPSLFRLIGEWSAVSIVMVCGIIGGTMLIGRFYCGIVCPLGTVQDVFFFLSRRKKKGKMGHNSGNPWIQVPIFLSVTLFAILGSTLLLSLLDPFAVFGRTAALAVKPLVILGGGAASSILQLFGMYPIMPEKLPFFAPLALSLSVAVFFSAAVLALFRGRIYCNTVCPVGTILGWCSRNSLKGITIAAEKCTNCMKCTRQCRSSCIDISRHEVDKARCTLCFDCIDVCPERAVSYSKAPRTADSAKIANPSRRKFLARIPLAAGSAAAVAAAVALSPKAAASVLPLPDEGPVAPPGSMGYEHLTSLCVSCNACIAVCPTQVIRPAFLEYGPAGLFNPVLDFSHGFCEYGCTSCLEICPAGAINPVSLTGKKRIQIGVSNLDIEKCVVKLKGEDCGACAEACPTRAVVMVEYEDGLFYPETRNSYCIGCGACEHACPARPLAITVTGKRIHARASMVHADVKQIQSKSEIKSETDSDSDEEFPF